MVSTVPKSADGYPYFRSIKLYMRARLTNTKFKVFLRLSSNE